MDYMIKLRSGSLPKQITKTIILIGGLIAYPAQAIETLYYFQNDQLGTPQVMTDENQTVVWQADYKPFGETTITVAAIENNLRFPGQYYDSESGLNYNYFRDYDPSVGRYTESDPIGLAGGINTYGYVGGNPVGFVDPDGLAPGDLFPSRDEAAVDAINFVRKNYSLSNVLEYCGLIEKTKEGCFTYNEIITGGPIICIVNSVQLYFGNETTDVAYWHIHPGLTASILDFLGLGDGSGGEGFSNIDIASSIETDFPYYVGTPEGNVLVFDPSNGVTQNIYPAR